MKPNIAKLASMSCPCGRPRSYAACCGTFHAGSPAPDAESLMRSRYAAYVLAREDYLLATWHASTRPAEVNLTTTPRPQWLVLEVRSATDNGDSATVEFVARYRIEGRGHRLHEVSRFVREEGRWFYVEGTTGSGNRQPDS